MQAKPHRTTHRTMRATTKSLQRGRFAMVTALLSGAMVTVLPAGSPLARGDGWQPFPSFTFDAACGAKTVHVAGSQKQHFRETVLPDGTIEWQITGSLKLTYSTDDGKSVIANSSGPGYFYFLPNGDIHVLGEGINSFQLTPEQAETLGVPQILVSAGPIDLTFHPDGTVNGHMGNIIQDVCAELN